MKRSENQSNELTSNIKIIIKGSIFSAIITLVLLFIYSCILTFTNVSDSTIPVIVIILTIISILMGSSLATNRIKSKGLINGSLVGGIYLCTIYIVSSFLNTGFNFNLYSIIMLATGILAGGIGGIMGVNMKR